MKLPYRAGAALLLTVYGAASAPAQENAFLPPALSEAWQSVLSSPPPPDSGDAAFYWEPVAVAETLAHDLPRPVADTGSFKKMLAAMPEAAATDLVLWLLASASKGRAAGVVLELFAGRWAAQAAAQTVLALMGLPDAPPPVLFSDLTGVQDDQLLKPPAVIEPMTLAPR